MKLEKFDLEKVIHGTKVVTRDGREVTQLSKFNTYRKLCLYGVVDDEVECWTIEGYYMDGCNTVNMDLFIEGKARRAWVNIYGNGRDIITSGGYRTREDATRNIREDYEYIKTIEITDEL